jgi:hypothetical protein
MSVYCTLILSTVLGTHLVESLAHDRRAQPVPRHKRQIRIRALVPHQPLTPTLLQLRFNHARNSPDLSPVPVEDRLRLLLSVEREPSPLAEVRALARSLEVQPGLSEELVGGGGVGEGVGGVVGREQVLDDGAGFPEGDVVVVGVGDGGDAAVGVDGFEGFCCFVCQRSLLFSLRVFLDIGKRGIAAYLGAER